MHNKNSQKHRENDCHILTELWLMVFFAMVTIAFKKQHNQNQADEERSFFFLLLPP